MTDHTDRHPATTQILRWFDYSHLTDGFPQDVSKMVSILADDMVEALPDGPELITGLRKLLEAKDCFVRASFEDASRRLPDAGSPPEERLLEAIFGKRKRVASVTSITRKGNAP